MGIRGEDFNTNYDSIIWGKRLSSTAYSWILWKSFSTMEGFVSQRMALLGAIQPPSSDSLFFT